MVRALAIDVGTTSVRTAIVDTLGNVSNLHQRPLVVHTPNPGEVELDAEQILSAVTEVVDATTREGGPCEVVGITNQRATTIVFDPATGRSVGPAIGWQDLRTVIDCLILQGSGIRLAPNVSATKARWLVQQSGRPSTELRFATVETWIAWHLTGGRQHVTDRSNAGLTGLVALDLDSWDANILGHLELDEAMMPRIVDTMCDLGEASALSGAPRITALVGDQVGSLFGQSCVNSGAKITFGTGAMLDMVHPRSAPTALTRLNSGCFPTVAFSRSGQVTWGVEGVVLSAGACLEWLRDDLGIIDAPSETSDLARSVPSSDGVGFVPALSGLGTPYWDFGARGGFFGLTRGSTRAHMVRAVLEGIAHRGADLVDAAHVETGIGLDSIRIDGGMSANDFMVQCLADFTGLRVEVSSEREATTRGAGLMALVSAGELSLDDVERLWRPASVVEPALDDAQRQAARASWRSLVARVERTIPELSEVSF